MPLRISSTVHSPFVKQTSARACVWTCQKLRVVSAIYEQSESLEQEQSCISNQRERRMQGTEFWQFQIYHA